MIRVALAMLLVALPMPAGGKGHEAVPLAATAERSAIEDALDGWVESWWQVRPWMSSARPLGGVWGVILWSTPRVAPSKSDHRPAVEGW